MMKTKMLFVLILVLAVGIETHSQSERYSIQVGGTTLKLGMPQGGVLQQLGQSYDLMEKGNGTGKSSSWMVVSKDHHETAYANVYFKDGILASVYKYWDVDSPTTDVGLAKDFFGAVSNFEEEGNTYCSIHAAQTQNPGTEVKTVF